MPKITATDPGEQKVLDDVSKFGWHCMNVFGDDEHEPFSYTVGLFQTYGHPELLIYGLPSNIAHSVLNIAAEAAASGKAINLSESTDELLNGYSCVFVPVPLTEYAEHLGFARWYYDGDNFPVQQVVWPSKTGLFPWHPEATIAFRTKQPVLGQAARGS
jgi:Domain of unknown function (DUF4262)